MTRIPLSLGSLVVIAASALVGCRAGDTPEQPRAIAAAPHPEAPIGGTPDEDTAAADTQAMAAENPDDVACAMPPAASKTNSAQEVRAVVAKTTSATRALVAAIASEVQRDDNTNLDEAIQREIESAPPQNATAPEPVGITTTTGATVARAPGASASSGQEDLAFVNRLPPGYDLRRVRMTVDGLVVYDGLGGERVSIARGDHVVGVVVDFAARESLFSSREDIHVEARSTHTLSGAGGVSTVAITAADRGDVTLPIERRVAIQWREVP